MVRPGAGALWYCVSKDGRATLCTDEDDAIAEVARDTVDWPLHAPYRAVQLVDVANVADAVAAERKRWAGEVAAWRERFPGYTYRPQDDCVALKA